LTVNFDPRRTQVGFENRCACLITWLLECGVAKTVVRVGMLYGYKLKGLSDEMDFAFDDMHSQF
jgi:hypothetical protein